MDGMRINLHDLLMPADSKKHGFQHQRLVVLPAPIRRAALSQPLLRPLLVTDAGFFPRAAGHLIKRPRGTDTTLLLRCTDGSGWIKLGGNNPLPVTPNTLAWLPARQPHAYGTGDDPWTIEWLHLTGSEVAAWRDLLGLPASGGVRPASSDLGHVWQHLERGYSLPHLVTASATLRNALLALARQSPVGEQTARERVAATVEWMNTRLAQPLRLADLAKQAALSVPHYNAIFRQLTGFAPIDWLIRRRIQRACLLLDTTAIPVKNIAPQVGIPDPYYFTRAFRKIMGASPRAYRQIPKG